MKGVEVPYRSPTQRLLDDPQIAMHPFFADMEPARIREILNHSQMRHFEAREFLFHEHAPADRLFLLLTGAVALETRADGGHLVRVCTAKENEVVGWSWLFPPFAWHFHAQALEPTDAVVCDGGHLLVMCEDDPVFGYEFMKRIVHLVIQRLHATRKQLISIEGILNPPVASPVIH